MILHTATVTPVQVLMIGDCTLATSYMPHHYRNEVLLAQRLHERYPHEEISVINEGLDGESIAGFLKRYDRTFARYAAPDFVIVRYGVNDRRAYGIDGFSAVLNELVDRLSGDFPRAHIVLETGMFVDYPAHYEFDRNSVLQPLYEVIRELARDRQFPLVDIYSRMARETAAGNWDLRVRGYGVVDEEIPVLGAGQDHLHEGDIRWFTNIHPNPRGIAVIADEEAQVLTHHWPTSLRANRHDHCAGGR